MLKCSQLHHDPYFHKGRHTLTDGFLHALFVELVLAHLVAIGGGDGRILSAAALLVVSVLVTLQTRIGLGVVIFAVVGVRNLSANESCFQMVPPSFCRVLFRSISNHVSRLMPSLHLFPFHRAELTMTGAS